jgi:hypothetical protein
MIAKRCLLVLAVMGLTFLFTPTAHPASEYTVESLRGLTGVGVLVESFSSEVKDKLPFDKNQIRVDVELKLRMAGIKVLSDEERFNTPGMPFLYVRVYIGETSDLLPDLPPVFGYNITVQLHQQVYLARNSELLFGTTWEKSVTGAVNIKNVSITRDRIRNFLDQFIYDYFLVNPKGGK